ncbi:hypothetical protein R1sor_017219 [Riccia sorocarpa]|uniref:Reverse transcriptase domain-containing protein n=1 Tax=Riccia sorocarpa TaxID=122646 RepID=A0ABD3I656_9MARC
MLQLDFKKAFDSVNWRLLQDTLKAFNFGGLQIQWDKSAARWIGPEDSSKPQWADDLNWCWKDKGEATKLLGFSFEDCIRAGDMLQKCKNKINEICSSIMYDKLSICGRITVANATILGAFWRARCTQGRSGKISPYGGRPKEAQMGIRKANTRAKKLLWEEGYRKIGDLTDGGSDDFRTWELRKIRGSKLKSVQAAYKKLTENMKLFNQITLAKEATTEKFYEERKERGSLDVAYQEEPQSARENSTG